LHLSRRGIPLLGATCVLGKDAAVDDESDCGIAGAYVGIGDAWPLYSRGSGQRGYDAVAHEAAVHEETKHDETKSDELTRKPKIKVSPVYPEIARRMSITGTVRLAVVVAPNGTVKSSKAIGGHPMLVNAAQDAMRQWRFEPAVAESSGIVEFKFQPQE
jgi:TonB family protein